jgi:hypothetical protein
VAKFSKEERMGHGAMHDLLVEHTNRNEIKYVIHSRDISPFIQEIYIITRINL